jgi:rod shape-determining protein MreC
VLPLVRKGFWARSIVSSPTQGAPVHLPGGKGAVIRLSPPRHAAIQRIVFPVLILLSLIMIILGKVDQVMFEPLRIWLTDAAGPTLDAMSRPVVAAGNLVDYAAKLAHLHQENARLEEENVKLLHWQQAALALASENAQLRGLLKLVPESAVSYVTARVIADSGGAYVRNLMVDAGSDSGVSRGQAAITGAGLVGRVEEVGTRTARILLVTDLNSRVPAIIGRSRQRAILSGDNSEHPSLVYLDPAGAVKIGDRIVTSGEGGVFPPGLPVGVVAGVDGEAPRVEPYVDLSRVEYLRIVDYGLAGGLPTRVGGGRRGELGTARGANHH